jgi:release factor glutamine methyltransferase
MGADAMAHAGRDLPSPSWGAQLVWGERTLAASGSPSPRLDATALLMHAVHAPPALLLAQPERLLSAAEVARYASWVERRAAGEPVAYITGHKAFMSLDLLVDRRVLLVRPSTVWLVEAALESLRSRPPQEHELLVADIGTGCGAIALALGLFEPRIAHIYAVDCSADALEVAQANGARYLLNVLVSWLEGDILDPVPEPVDLIVANLPYLRRELGQTAPAALAYEPNRALFSEEEGLAHIRTLIAQTPAKLRPGGTLLFALDDEQRPAVAKLLAEALPQAYIWFGPSRAGGDHFAVAQVPRGKQQESEKAT